MLPVFAGAVCIRVREAVCPMMRGDNALLATSISRQPRVAVWVQVPSQDAITYSEARLLSNRSRHRIACAQADSDLFRSCRFFATWHTEFGPRREFLDLRLDFLPRKCAAGDDCSLHSREPPFVVRRS